MRKDVIAEKVYVYIRTYFKQHGFAPSLRDISEGCSMSHSNVIRYLDKLEAQGLISRELRKPRSISLLDELDEGDA